MKEPADDSSGKNKKQRDKSVHFSSLADDWTTPRWFYSYMSIEFDFNLDPCSTHENCLCERHFTKVEDGLSQDWGDSVAFMNPPYGRRISAWMQKAYESARNGATVVCLVPGRSDTVWWHRYAMKGEVRLLKGRLKFGDGKNSAPFPSAVVIFRPPSFALKAVTLIHE